jgi:hypothetical protein
MTNEGAYCTDVILCTLGKGQRAAHKARDSLSQCVIEPLDVVGFAGALGDGFVLCSRNHIAVGNVLVGREEGPLPRHIRTSKKLNAIANCSNGSPVAHLHAAPRARSNLQFQ